MIDIYNSEILSPYLSAKFPTDYPPIISPIPKGIFAKNT